MENQLNFTYLIRFSGDVTYRRHNSRSLFEKLVLRNIILAMKKHNVFFKVYKLSSRIILKTNKDVSNVLNKIFGISSFSYCNEINFENLEELAKKSFRIKQK
jgi:Thiamine biosynthesis ATP pyrophosphatase